MACLKCGQCCREFNIGIRPGGKKMELIEAHGIDTSGDIMIHITHTCQHLDEETNLCKIYGGPDDERPQICKDFLCKKAVGALQGEIK